MKSDSDKNSKKRLFKMDTCGYLSKENCSDAEIILKNHSEQQKTNG